MLPRVGIGIFDENLRFVSVNPALAAMNGVPREEHIGHRLGEILGKVSTRAEAALECVLNTRQTFANLGLREKLPGRERVGRWVQTTFPISDGTGPLKGLAVFVVEIACEQENMNQQLSDGHFVPSSEEYDCLRKSGAVVANGAKSISQPPWHRKTFQMFTEETVKSSPALQVVKELGVGLAELALMQLSSSRWRP
jgi:hypothetical protein